ncbi:unnamed protein product [Ilex paraguariensis]|uniref:Serine carboxypeptidase-like 18 n=1 Tax=Ilex paraguariensis TaxID=185542 RepID=A0ABC8RJ23_9AQUA
MDPFGIGTDSSNPTITIDLWLMDHPKFLDNPLYIAGDSYTGIVVPIIVQEIYNGNDNGNKPSMNIEGYLEGNPLTDKSSDVNSRVKFAHRVALISDELYESTKSNCHREYTDVDPNNALCVNDLQLVQESTKSNCHSEYTDVDPNNALCVNDLQLVQEEDNYVYSYTWANDRSVQNALHVREEDNYVYSYTWANDRSVQNALHVREEWQRCNNSIHYVVGAKSSASYTFNVQSTVEYHRNLSEKRCRALIYSGDHDMVVPHEGTEEWIRSLNFPVESGWKPWFVEGQVAGSYRYTTKYAHNDYELTYATVKGAGHTAPEYKPRQCLAMVSRWFASYPLKSTLVFD